MIKSDLNIRFYTIRPAADNTILNVYAQKKFLLKGLLCQEKVRKSYYVSQYYANGNSGKLNIIALWSRSTGIQTHTHTFIYVYIYHIDTNGYNGIINYWPIGLSSNLNIFNKKFIYFLYFYNIYFYLKSIALFRKMKFCMLKITIKAKFSSN